MSFFIYDNVTGKVKISEYEILLVKEFKELWDPSRNICKEDPTGIKRIKANAELTYIWLMLDWKSPYFQYLEKDKHEISLEDAELNNEDLKDQLFINAYNKYNEILESDRVLSLIKVAYRALYKTEIFLDNIDYTEVDYNGKPLYKPADVLKDLREIGKMRTDLLELEKQHKTNVNSKTKVRGDNEPGWGDM